MADKEISTLTAASTLAGTELVHVVQGGNSRQTTLQDIANLAPPTPVVIDDETTGYTVVNGDLAGSVIKGIDSGSPFDVTVNSGLTGLHPCVFYNKGAGQVSFVAGGGVTILSAGGALSLRVQYSAATLIPLGSDVYLLSGDIEA